MWVSPLVFQTREGQEILKSYHSVSSVPLIFILYPVCVCLRETILPSHLLGCVVDLWYGEGRRSGIPALSKQPYLQQNFHRYLMIPIPGSLFEKFPKISGNFSPLLIAGFLICALSFQTFLAVVSILVYFVFAGLCLSRKKKRHYFNNNKNNGRNELNANG